MIGFLQLTYGAMMNIALGVNKATAGLPLAGDEVAITTTDLAKLSGKLTRYGIQTIDLSMAEAMAESLKASKKATRKPRAKRKTPVKKPT
jgi:hypothetical protein